MKKILRKIRDNRQILTLLVWMLKAFRSIGIFKSEKFYRHVPFRGLIKVKIETDNYFKIISRGGHIENTLYWEGTYLNEAVSMRTWVKYARESRVVLDIGANSGVYALAAAAMGAKQVHAFEPLPRIYKILNENLALNSFKSLNAWKFAISDNPGEASLYDPGGDAPTSASLSSKFSQSHLFEGFSAIKVPMISIDVFCSDRGIDKVDLIKIDVEGHEEYALRGMIKTVMQCRPVIIMEVLEEYDEQLRSVVNILFEGIYRWDRIIEQNNQKSINVLLTPLI